MIVMYANDINKGWGCWPIAGGFRYQELFNQPLDHIRNVWLVPGTYDDYLD